MDGFASVRMMQGLVRAVIKTRVHSTTARATWIRNSFYQ